VNNLVVRYTDIKGNTERFALICGGKMKFQFVHFTDIMGTNTMLVVP